MSTGSARAGREDAGVDRNRPEAPAGYRTQSPDTSYEVERLLVQALRDLPIWRKGEMLTSLCRAVQEVALAGLKARYPGADDRELRLRLAALRLDRETMVRVFGWDPGEKGY